MRHQILCWAGTMLVGMVVLWGLLGDVASARAYTAPEPRSGPVLVADFLQNAPERQGPFDIDLVPVFGADIAGLRYRGDSAALSVITDPRSIQDADDRPSLALRARPEASDHKLTNGAGNESSPGEWAAALEIDLDTEFPHAFIFVTWRLFTAYASTPEQSEVPSTFFIDVEDQSARRNLVSVKSGDPRLLPVSHSLVDATALDHFLTNEQPGSPQAPAGITELRTSGFLVDGTGAITIRLEIAHGNDSPAGTMVVIDRIELTSMLPVQLQQGGSDCVTFQENCSNLFPVPGTFFDPGFPERPPRFCELQADGQGQDLDLDLQEPLEFRGTIITTVIADGEIRIPLGGFISDEPREEFEISFFEGNAPEDGGFGEFGSFDRLPVVTVPTFSYQGQTVGLAQFLVPETFVTDSLDLETEYGPARRVRLNFCFQNPGGLDRICFVPPPVEIRRPPVVLMHGIWSESATWQNFDLRTSEVLDVRVADYRLTNASSFEENRVVPAHMLSRICADYQALGWFFTQADVIGHSMGGLLAREYLANATPFTTINRLYTLNTPHSGSEWANLVKELREHPDSTTRFAFILFMERWGMSVVQGAIDDLAVGSEALSLLPTTGVLSHALVGVGGSVAFNPGLGLALAPGRIGDVYRFASRSVDLDGFFEGVQHDLVVRRPSQIGGLPLGTYTIFEGLDSIHTEVTSSREYSERILCDGSANESNGSCERGSGLASSTGTGEFSFFPAPTSVSQHKPPLLNHESDKSQRELIEEGVVIVSPSAGSVFQSGDQVTVTLDSVAPFEAEDVLLGSRFAVTEMTGPPFTSSFEIPIEFVGRFDISAYAKDDQGNIALSAVVEIDVEAPGELLGLAAYPPRMYLRGPSDRQQITVTGDFSDGVQRDLTDESAGTIFVSSDTSVVEVTSQGLAIPRGDGLVTVVVQNGGLEHSMTIEVSSFDLGDIFRDRFEALASVIGLWGFRASSDNP